MSEFKFACPVCGQHLTADSTESGGHIECPTCFQQIVVPQGPSSPDSKFIVSASQVSKPRQVTSNSHDPSSRISPPVSRAPIYWLTALCVGFILCTAAVLYGIKAFKPALATVSPPPEPPAPPQAGTTSPKPGMLPANLIWTLDLSNVEIPDAPAQGTIHGIPFVCERASLQGNILTLRDGKNGPALFGMTIALPGREGRAWNDQTIEIQPDNKDIAPHVVLRWKNEKQQGMTLSLIEGCALRISFGAATEKRISGRLYIAMPDESRSFVVGTFDAEIRKPSPPKGRKPGKP